MNCFIPASFELFFAAPIEHVYGPSLPVHNSFRCGTKLGPVKKMCMAQAFLFETSDTVYSDKFHVYTSIT